MALDSLFSVQPIVAEIKFVGLAFYLSLFFLWFLAQGLIWLSVRYSRLISTTKWWKSAVVAFIATFLMVIGWGIPNMITGSDYLIYSMTTAIASGTIATWILCGFFYNLEIVHRAIVAIGVPLLCFCTIAMGLVVGSKII